MVGLPLWYSQQLGFTDASLSAAGLEKVTAEKVAAAMQVSDTNPMVGIEGRAALLSNLSKALKANPQFFGNDGRPGNVVGL